MPCDSSVTIELTPDVATVGSEAYLCFGFDAASLDGRAIRGVRWSVAANSGVSLHHATLFATQADYPIGPAACDAMSTDAIVLHVYAPGGSALDLGDDVGLVIGSGVRRFVVEAHALRVSNAAPGTARAELCLHESEPPRRAAWIGVGAPVPAIRPLHVETSTGSCTLGAPFEVLSSWPHMHRIGSEFHGAVVRSSGVRESLVDIPNWDFNEQRTYRVDARLEAGDAIETTCIWENPTDDYVLPGPLTSNEMCNQGIIGVPAEAAGCVSADGGT